MTKYLVTIDFRYSDAPKHDNDYIHKGKTTTLGVFDTMDEAIIEGNKALEIFEKHFPLNKAWNKKDRFGKNNGPFGSAKNLITPLAYLQCPFDFYARISTLNYLDVEETILNVLSCTKRYREYKLKEKDE
jgi:hypothetical protein